MDPKIELHTHLGGAVDPATMWELAHEQGIKLPYSDYFEFESATNISEGTDGLDGLNKVYHFTELIQSSPEGVQRAVYQALAHGYRTQNICDHEIRFNPAKRNRGGERDLDAIILAATHGLDRATIDYNLNAGLILMMDRRQSIDLNAAIVKRAIKFKDRGVVGVDIGGPRPNESEFYDYCHQIGHMIEKAQSAGLGVTIHVGEEGYSADDPDMYMREMWDVLSMKPDRIGHGIIASKSPALMQAIVDADVLLEVCPTSNIRTGAVSNWQQMDKILSNFWTNDVKFAICTDGPFMIGTNLNEELMAVSQSLGLNVIELTQKWARENSFL